MTKTRHGNIRGPATTAAADLFKHKLVSNKPKPAPIQTDIIIPGIDDPYQIPATIPTPEFVVDILLSLVSRSGVVS